MVMDGNHENRKMAARGKYQGLYAYLLVHQAQEWRTSFSEIEAIIGFELPPSARIHRPWWANRRSASGHTQALAWNIAGWETAEVDMHSETLTFRRRSGMEADRIPSLDEVWPVHPTARWPEGLNLRRQDLYEVGD